MIFKLYFEEDLFDSCYKNMHTHFLKVSSRLGFKSSWYVDPPSFVMFHEDLVLLLSIWRVRFPITY